MESCHCDSRSESARASGVPTAYPTDLYTFMGFISTKEKDHAAADAGARSTVARRAGATVPAPRSGQPLPPRKQLPRHVSCRTIRA
jgi:hypothetical protein